jgi:hypothetical protein
LFLNTGVHQGRDQAGSLGRRLLAGDTPSSLAEVSAALASAYIADRRAGATSSNSPKQAEAMIVSSQADYSGTSGYRDTGHAPLSTRHPATVSGLRAFAIRVGRSCRDGPKRLLVRYLNDRNNMAISFSSEPAPGFDSGRD